MGHIKEPKGVDFIIKSEPLTNEEREVKSKFICEYKAKLSRRKIATKTRLSSSRKKTSPENDARTASKSVAARRADEK